MSALFTIENFLALLTLTGMEIILGFDNILVVAMNVARLPREQQRKGRIIGMSGALVTRILLLSVLSYVVGFIRPLFTVFDHAISLRDIILILGGGFLIAKAAVEIREEWEGAGEHKKKGGSASFLRVIIEISLWDIIFSLDSVITAVGMAKNLIIMISAVILSMVVMVGFAKMVGDFIQSHASVKILALAFLILIGFTLVASGVGHEIEKGLIYACMGFASFVNMIDLRRHSNAAKRGVETRHEHHQE